MRTTSRELKYKIDSAERKKYLGRALTFTFTLEQRGFFGFIIEG